MSKRNILQVDMIDRGVIRIIVEKAINFGVTVSSMARAFLHLGMDGELKAKGILIMAKMVKKDWGDYTIEDWDREQESEDDNE